MRKPLALILAVALFAVLAATALAATKNVKVGDNYFVRSSGVPTVTVTKNTYVKWVFSGDSSHNVSVTKGPVKFTSPVKSSGSYRKRMTRKGTYTIICTIHGAADQKMKLVVK
jgi:plastocyanin